MKRQLRNRVFGLAAGTVAFGAISACGGGGVGDAVGGAIGGGGQTIAEGGIRGTGSSVGPVSGFGSVFVNGVEFSTDAILNRKVESNDGITAEGQLSEGMILRVEGDWRNDGTGTAEKLSYDDTLRGPVGLITPDPSGAGKFVTLTVMGQSVRVDRQTVVRGTTFTALLGGGPVTDHVRVSAWRQADGSYRAGYIETITPDLADIELEGSVTAVATGQKQFTIGTITVQYDEKNVRFGSGLTEADLETATVLEVEGSLAGNVLRADAIDRDDARRFRRNSSGDIEFTATIDSPFPASEVGAGTGEFRVGGLTVRVTETTILGGNITLTDLTEEGLLVQVEGTFLSDTVVEAEEITLREANAKVEGVIGRIDSATGPFEVGGVRVKMTPLTILTRDDDNAQASDPLGLKAQVEVEGIEKTDASGVYIEALKVEVDNQGDGGENNQFELEGRLQSITDSPGSISILGVQMDDLGAKYDSENENAADENTARGTIVEAFKSTEAVMLEVEYVSSNSSTGAFTATEIELQEKDNDNGNDRD
ncbi:MAG: DUF5666 domain-containing protein [Pseudomonadota bacterium]|nr:DUF5666 domain-containing protein [Pseudomonadota bacterium]